MSPDLNARQSRFVEEYLLDLNGKQAAIRAGYSAKTAEVQASRLLSHAKVAVAVAAAKARRAARVEVTQDYVLGKLVENLERSLQAVPVVDREGEETGEYQYEGAVANGALRMLGEHVGMYKQKHELTGKDGGPLVPTSVNVRLVTPRDGG